jgi:glycosyltransferase involved in cell wall biosynthesis
VKAEPRISVAIPLCDEGSTLPELRSRLRAVLDEQPGGPHELVFVDDGSTDDTGAALETARAQDPCLVAVTLSRNFGHQMALAAALDHATGDVVIVMDGDLQDPPEAIPRFLERYHAGFDVVYAERVARKEGALLRLAYFLFYRVIACLATIRLPLDAGDFALLSRRVVNELARAPERHRYLRGLRTWVGFQQTGIPVERGERVAGRSKYGLAELLGLAGDGIFAFSTVPLRAATLCGGITVAGSLLFGAYSLWARFFLDQSPKGFTALILTIIFMGGVQLLFLGVIGEYLGRVYEEVKARPQYVLSHVARTGDAPRQD